MPGELVVIAVTPKATLDPDGTKEGRAKALREYLRQLDADLEAGRINAARALIACMRRALPTSGS